MEENKTKENEDKGFIDETKDELAELLQSIQDKESKSIKIKKSLLVKGALLALGLYIF
jgi:hypothetical protein